MRRSFLIITFLTLLAPFNAAAHPGMTDRYDGHKCFKKCENWGILYAEYHLHDKDRKPVRVAKKNRAQQEETGERMAPVEPVVLPQTAPPPAEVVRQVVIVRERNVSLIDLLLLMLLALLILWLILRMNRRKEGTEVRVTERSR